MKDREAIYTHIGSTTKALAVFTGGSDSVFTDRLGTGGLELNPKIKQATRELSLAFLVETFAMPSLKAVAPSISRWRDTHAPMLARFERRG